MITVVGGAGGVVGVEVGVGAFFAAVVANVRSGEALGKQQALAIVAACSN